METNIKSRKRYFIDRFVPYTKDEYRIAKETGIEIWIIREVLNHLETYYIASWPENIRTEILGYSEVTPMTDDQYAGLLYAIDTTLTEREGKCIYGYYRDDATLREIGQEFGVTVERIRQIIAKGLRKLRHQAIIPYILVGFDGAEARKKRTAMDIGRMLAKEHEDFMTRMAKPDESIYSKDLSEIPISELDLTTRSHNALYRSGITTLYELTCALEKGSVANLYNIGVISLNEIESKMGAFLEVYRNGQHQVSS